MAPPRVVRSRRPPSPQAIPSVLRKQTNLDAPRIAEIACEAGACFIVQAEWEALAPLLCCAAREHPLYHVELRNQGPARRSAEAAINRLENICRWAGPASISRAGAQSLLDVSADVRRRVRIGQARKFRRNKSVRRRHWPERTDAAGAPEPSHCQQSHYIPAQEEDSLGSFTDNPDSRVYAPSFAGCG